MEKAREYLAAARQVENVICTSRESLLGSSAWRQEFLAQLKSRPFYFVTDLPHHLCEVFIPLSLSLTSHFLFIFIAFSIVDAYDIVLTDDNCPLTPHRVSDVVHVGDSPITPTERSICSDPPTTQTGPGIPPGTPHAPPVNKT